MNMNKLVITIEECDACSTPKEFSLENLFALDLFYSYDFTEHTICYQGEWDCSCGHTNNALGQCDLLDANEVITWS